jgi:hypothetical protein
VSDKSYAAMSDAPTSGKVDRGLNGRRP